jgi:two-component system response regulator YesN
MFDPGQIREGAFSYYHRLHRVQEHVEGHLGEPLTLSDAAAVARLEKTYFSSFFHEKVGVCFRDWLTYVRIHHAMELIAAHNTPIRTVGEAVGYGEVRTFQRAFRRCVGLNPSAFRGFVRPS